MRGLIPAEVGFCHGHEHLFIADGFASQVDPGCLNSYEHTLAELELFKQVGAAGWLMPSPWVRQRRICSGGFRRSQIHIVASTGFHKPIYYPPERWIHTVDEEVLAQIFQSELEEGMYLDGDWAFPSNRSSIPAGVIKAASDTAGVTAEYRRLFTAAGLAARETGASVLTHTEKGAGALEQVELLLDLGLAPESIILSHLDRSLADFSYHVEVAQTGVYLQYDTIARPKYHSDRAEAEHILRMVEAGFAHQILLGLDLTRARMRAYGGSPGLDHLAVRFLPLLQDVGLDREVIEQLTVRNPARALRIKNA